MRIEQIKQIIKIAECGSINKAAQEMNTSQSNISQSVQSLEEEIGHEIFRRSGKGAILTKFGEEFMNYALATFDQFNMTMDFSKNYNKKDVPLKFSAASQYIRFACLLFIEIYKKYASPGSEFSFLEGSLLDVIKNVTSRRAEIGLVVILNATKKTTVNLIKSRGLVYQPIQVCQPSIMVGKQNPLYNLKEDLVTPDMIKDYPLIVFNETGRGGGEGHFNFPPKLLSQYGARIRRNLIIVSDAFTLNEFLLNTNAYFIGAFTKAYEKMNANASYRTFKLLDNRLSLEMGWIRSAGQPLSAHGKEYIKMIEESLKTQKP